MCDAQKWQSRFILFCLFRGTISVMEKKTTVHPIPPVFDENSRILILGSFPSVKSRETGFFYGHPQNRFWKVLSRVFEDEIPQDIPEKRDFLLKHQVAVWDVIASCDIRGSSDASITNVIVNDLSEILNKADIKAIYVNGTKAYKLYVRYMAKQTDIKCTKLPSTSPANAAWGLERLYQSWKVIRNDIIDL